MQPKNTFKQIQSKETANFILDSLNETDMDILEVGCGDGEVALELAAKGKNVTAIDTNSEKIDNLKNMEVNALCVDFIKFNSTSKYDAVIFTRSLHHIHNLRNALKHVLYLLKPSGKLILEEFDYENTDYKSLKWYYEKLSKYNPQLQIPADPVERWISEHISEHDEKIHSGTEIINEVKSQFTNITVSRCLYYYRYISDFIRDSDDKYDKMHNILLEEKKLITNGAIIPIGLRIVSQT